MPKKKVEWWELKVWSTKEPLVFLVESRTHPDAHRVDLLAYDGHGSCQCQFFTFTAESKLKMGSKEKMRCSHIKAARRWEKQWLLERLIEEMLKSKNNRQQNYA